MDWNWIWEGPVSRLIYDTLVLATGGGMFFLRMRQSRWSSPILYGLSASTLAALLLYAVGVHHAFVVSQDEQTTMDNVQERVRSWIDNFGLTSRSNPGNDRYFG